MNRRSWIRVVAGAGSLLPLRTVRVWAQTIAFPAAQTATLSRLAATVLPESLGAAETESVAEQFAAWVRQYRPGAELQTGYGVTRVRFQGASPAPLYIEQLSQLVTTALAPADLADRRKRLAGVLAAAGIEDLTTVPAGKHIVADLMSFYFGGSAANDLAYGAAIGREKCRSLERSELPPAPLKGSPRARG